MTIMRCDRCGREVGAGEKRYNVVVQEAQSYNGNYITMRNRDLCNDCYSAFLRFLERNRVPDLPPEASDAANSN